MNHQRWRFLLYYYKYRRYYQYFHHFIIPLVKKKHDHKVFCLGASKTGLSSLSKALSILGYRTVQWFREGKEPENGWVDYIKKSNYDAFVDSPMRKKDLYKQLDKNFSNSLFILTIRDTHSWIKSYVKYFQGSPWGIRNNQEKERLIQEYEEDNNQIISYFRTNPNKLLLMNIIEGDRWEKLCTFLHKKIPDCSFPHRNKGN